MTPIAYNVSKMACNRLIEHIAIDHKDDGIVAYALYVHIFSSLPLPLPQTSHPLRPFLLPFPISHILRLICRACSGANAEMSDIPAPS